MEETQTKEGAFTMRRIGFIGYGLRSETMLKAFRALEADICVAAVADPRHAQIAPGTKDDPYLPKHDGMRTRRRCWPATIWTACSSARAARCIRRWPAGC